MYPAISLQRPGGRPLRSLAARLLAVVLAKLVVLLLIWWAVAPAVRTDTRPVAIERHLAPDSSSPASPAPTPQGQP